MTLAYLKGSPAILDSRFPLPLDVPFSTAQALAEGVTRDQLLRLCRLGLLRRPVKGAYVAAQVPDSRELRGRVVSLVAPPGSVLADWSATWYWTGLDRPGTQFECPPLTVLRFRGHERLRNGLVKSGQRWFRPGDVVPIDDRISVSTPIRTAWDLGRFSPRIIAIGGMDALCRRGSFEVAELVDGVERFRRQRGVVQLRRIAPLVDPRAESSGESALRLRWLETPGMPPPELQIVVVRSGGRGVFRLDLGLEELRFGAEYDGHEWHSSPEDLDHDERRRNELEEHGWCIVVFRRENVYGQLEDATARLVQALAEARRTFYMRTLR